MGLVQDLLRRRQEKVAIRQYDLALEAKYKGQWAESLRGNERAQEQRPGDEATLWNLAIAATALREWDRARTAWRALGIPVLEDEGEVRTPETKACVRLDPGGSGEVVWGTRIDPARIRVENVPFASSGRRFGDVILNDGAPEGYRTWNGEEYPVFDELEVWEPSTYSTFHASLVVPNETAMERLETLCRDHQLWVEDWGTVRNLCAQCSRGRPSEHVCAEDAGAERRIGFAAQSQQILREVLSTWIDLENGARLVDLQLALDARTA